MTKSYDFNTKLAHSSKKIKKKVSRLLESKTKIKNFLYRKLNRKINDNKRLAKNKNLNEESLSTGKKSKKLLTVRAGATNEKINGSENENKAKKKNFTDKKREKLNDKDDDKKKRKKDKIDKEKVKTDRHTTEGVHISTNLRLESALTLNLVSSEKYNDILSSHSSSYSDAFYCFI